MQQQKSHRKTITIWTRTKTKTKTKTKTNKTVLRLSKFNVYVEETYNTNHLSLITNRKTILRVTNSLTSTKTISRRQLLLHLELIFCLFSFLLIHSHTLTFSFVRQQKYCMVLDRWKSEAELKPFLNRKTLLS